MTVKIDGTNTEANPAFTGADTDTGLQCGTNEVKLVTGGTARATVDSSGRLLVGHTSARTNFITTGLPSQIAVETDYTPYISATKSSNDQFEPFFLLAKTRGSIGGNTVVQNNDGLGSIVFQGADGSTLRQGAQISAFVDGTPGSNDMPTRLAFYTTSDGSGTSAERMRINRNGAVAFSDFGSMKDLNGVVTFKGFAGKQGQNDTSPGNVMNFHWTGSALQAWVDTSNVGTVSFTSDYRAKQNITSITANCIDRIKQLRPVQYEWANYKNLFVADGVTREGFIAHEVADVIPSGTNGAKDDPDQIQSLQPDAILSVTVKALQEAIAKIETLEAKVAALEAAS